MGSIMMFSGCADMEIPTVNDILKSPIGTCSIKRGMTKDQVKDNWGEPSKIRFEEVKEEGVSRTREIWVYQADFKLVPVDTDYLSETKFVYFDGDNVTNITAVPLDETPNKAK